MAEVSTILRLTVDMGTSGSPSVKKISEEVEASLELTKDTAETTSKDGGGWKTFLATLKTGTVSCTAFVSYTPATGFVSAADMYTLFKENYASTNKGIRTYTFEDPTVGSQKYSFSAIMTQLGRPAPLAEGMQVTFSLQITGAITETTVAS